MKTNQQLRPIEISPHQLIGRTVNIPDIKAYLRSAHEDKGWGPFQDHETQARYDFTFNGKMFRHFERMVFGKKSRIEKIYFPAAYAGAVALAIKQAGYDVFATDISPYWSSRLMGIGLRSERRSFEDLPDDHFDALVTFEPFAVPASIISIGIIWAMAAKMPCMFIYQAKNIERDIPRIGSGSLGVKEERLLARLKESKLVRNNGIALFENYHSLYGARSLSHLIYDGKSCFRIESAIPTDLSAMNALLDLELMESCIQISNDKHLSLSQISGIFGRIANEVASSLGRIQRLTDSLFSFDFSPPMIHSFKVIE